MTAILELPDRILTAEEIIPLMRQYQMMPQFLRGLILDRAIATVEYNEAERSQFCEHDAFENDQARAGWLQRQGLSPEQFAGWVDRELKIRKFQQEQWAGKLKTYFLERKRDLDRVVCSLIHVQDMEVAQELYFRIAEGEQSFAEVARGYSQGPEAQTGGIVGPIELGNLHRELAQMLYGGSPGKLFAPILIGEWAVIARLETLLPVQLDEAMQQFLLNELLETWLQDQLSQVYTSFIKS